MDSSHIWTPSTEGRITGLPVRWWKRGQASNNIYWWENKAWIRIKRFTLCLSETRIAEKFVLWFIRICILLVSVSSSSEEVQTSIMCSSVNIKKSATLIGCSATNLLRTGGEEKELWRFWYFNNTILWMNSCSTRNMHVNWSKFRNTMNDVYVSFVPRTNYVCFSLQLSFYRSFTCSKKFAANFVFWVMEKLVNGFAVMHLLISFLGISKILEIGFRYLTSGSPWSVFWNMEVILLEEKKTDHKNNIKCLWGKDMASKKSGLGIYSLLVSNLWANLCANEKARWDRATSYFSWCRTWRESISVILPWKQREGMHIFSSFK